MPDTTYHITGRVRVIVLRANCPYCLAEGHPCVGHLREQAVDWTGVAPDEATGLARAYMDAAWQAAHGAGIPGDTVWVEPPTVGIVGAPPSADAREEPG